MGKRTYGGPLIDVVGAADLHCHPYPDLFPRLADDFDIVRAARDAGMKAIMLKCHHESTVSRAYLVQRVIPGIRVYGGIVLNYYVGGLNAAAVEAALRLGGKEVWMPTVDAGYHAAVHGGTGGYDAQQGGRSQAEGIWIEDKEGKLRPEVKEILELVAQYGAILGTAHLAPREIVALVKEARSVGVEKIVITHPYFRVPNLDLDTLEEVARLGAMPELGIARSPRHGSTRQYQRLCRASSESAPPVACSCQIRGSAIIRCLQRPYEYLYRPSLR